MKSSVVKFDRSRASNAKVCLPCSIRSSNAISTHPLGVAFLFDVSRYVHWKLERVQLVHPGWFEVVRREKEERTRAKLISDVERNQWFR